MQIRLCGFSVVRKDYLKCIACNEGGAHHDVLLVSKFGTEHLHLHLTIRYGPFPANEAPL